MKKIYISADIEGIWGNSNPANTAKNGYLYSEYCTNMMNEVNLVIDLLFQNGVEEVVINDSHGNTVPPILPHSTGSEWYWQDG